MFDKLKKWLPWLLALVAGIYAWFVKFIEENPIPTDDVDTVTTMVLRTLGMG